jgi:hypothetical protein
MARKIMIFFVVYLFGARPAAALEAARSTLDDQVKVEVTVYNHNLALVKDTRKVSLPDGEGELRFMDVASAILPVTVRVQSLGAADRFKVLEQNYEYDLMDRNKLLDKFVGKTIRLIERKPFQDRSDVVEAVLLSNNNNQPVYQINGEIHLGHPGIHILPGLPDNLIARPTLMWLYANNGARTHDLEISYLTEGLDWKADYVLVVDQKDEQGDLAGWVTINNQSGASYRGATLKLVAGDVNRVQEQSVMRHKARAALMDASEAVAFSQEAFFEYHIYDLQRPTTIKDRQTKQISLLESSGVKLEKIYEVYGQAGYYQREYRSRDPKQTVEVRVGFKNSEANRLGMPLPGGVVRFYKRDSKSQLQFIGEDRIKHTPRDEQVSLKVGDAFDVVAERRQTDFRQITRHLSESAWEIKLRNRKEEDITVRLVEPMPSANWSMTQHSHDFVKKDAFTVYFDVRVPKDEEVAVSYRVQAGL